MLRAHGIHTVLVSDTATNVCGESTARDAMMMDYATIMVKDALSAFTPAEHQQARHNWMLFFGDVLSADEVQDRFHNTPWLTHAPCSPSQERQPERHSAFGATRPSGPLELRHALVAHRIQPFLPV